MNKEEKALDYFKNGFNCAQAVLTPFHEDFNLPPEELLKISCGFGAGMGRLQGTCGAVTGACFVIGLKYGKYLPEDDASREKTYEMVRTFNNEFRRINKTTDCRELLDADLMSDQGRQKYSAENLREKVCVKCIRDSIKILNKILI
jgi:C_GCAxxG_C_C family probable redox protein